MGARFVVGKSTPQEDLNKEPLQRLICMEEDPAPSHTTNSQNMMELLGLLHLACQLARRGGACILTVMHVLAVGGIVLKKIIRKNLQEKHLR